MNSCNKHKSFLFLLLVLLQQLKSLNSSSVEDVISTKTKRSVLEEIRERKMHRHQPLNLRHMRAMAPKVKGNVEWLDEIVAYQNQMREMHVANYLKLDHKLSNEALARATELAKKHVEKKEIDFGKLVPGDNEFAQKAKDGEHRDTLLKLDGTVAARSWYNEIFNEIWKKYEFNSNTRHASQLLWAATKTVGCGRAVTESKKEKPILIVICRYRPVGNDKAIFSKQVYPMIQPSEPI